MNTQKVTRRLRGFSRDKYDKNGLFLNYILAMYITMYIGYCNNINKGNQQNENFQE